MSLLDQTTAQLQERLEQIRAAESAPVWTSSRNLVQDQRSRPNLQPEKIAIMLELRRRGIAVPGSPNPDQRLLDTIASCQDMMVKRMGFAFHAGLVPLLQELLAFRRALRRPELTVEDVEAAWREMMDLGNDESSRSRDIMEWGLRRGFAMRAEERSTTTNETSTT